MFFHQTKLSGVYAIDLELRYDDRGAFSRTFCKKEFAQIGFTKDFVQMNQSWNLKKGTLRGMHYQNPPFSETKFIRVIRGAVLDIAIDIRQGSPTFLQHIAIELSDANHRCILIPEGFAHGFITLQDNTELIYHHTEYYAPGHEAGLRWDDDALGIDWPLTPSSLSDKDLIYPYIDTSFQGISI